VTGLRTSRPLDARGPRTDICPTCGAERAELPPEISPDRFYCSRCERATVGPNATPPPPPAPEQTGLFSVSDIGREPAGDERPPLDEYDSYPMPDE